MTDHTKTAKGVQELITRIRDEGVQAARQEAHDLVQKARAEAAEITESARVEAKTMKEVAHDEIEAERSAALESLRHAARDAVLDLRTRVRANFERHVRRLVSSTLENQEFTRNVVLALAGEAAEKYIQDRDARIFLSPEMFENGAERDAADAQARAIVLGVANEVLRQGIELVPANDIHAGARVRLVEDNLEIDLTDEAISDLLLRRILPRYRQIIEEA